MKDRDETNKQTTEEKNNAEGNNVPREISGHIASVKQGQGAIYLLYLSNIYIKHTICQAIY